MIKPSLLTTRALALGVIHCSLFAIAMQQSYAQSASATPSTIANHPSKKASELTGPTTDVIEHLDLVYAEAGGESLELDLHLPKRDAASKGQLRPLVVWIHGGGWRAGSRKPPRLRQLIDDGIAIASVSYRFTDKAVFPAQIHDCKAALRWLRANAAKYDLDPQRIAVAGSSAGGHLALLLGVSAGVGPLEGELGDHVGTSTEICAIVDYFGPSDFVLRGKTQPERAYTAKSGSLALLGGNADRRPDPQMEHDASPVFYVDQDDPPLLIFQGDGDETVLMDQSERMRDVYLEHKLPVELVVLPGAGHGGRKFYVGDPFEKARAFLKEHLSVQ